MRNLWSHSVIMCGHFPEGVQTFEKRSIDGETKPEWYVRQMLGSANISGSKLMHIMTGNLSHQIEHHLFPDLPSNRYAEIAPKVQDLFERYGLDYCARPLPQQVYSAWHKVVRLSLPNGWLDTTTPRNLPGQLKRLYQMTDRRPEGPPRPPGPDDPGAAPRPCRGGLRVGRLRFPRLSGGDRRLVASAEATQVEERAKNPVTGGLDGRSEVADVRVGGGLTGRRRRSLAR